MTQRIVFHSKTLAVIKHFFLLIISILAVAIWYQAYLTNRGITPLISSSQNVYLSTNFSPNAKQDLANALSCLDSVSRNLYFNNSFNENEHFECLAKFMFEAIKKLPAYHKQSQIKGDVVQTQILVINNPQKVVTIEHSKMNGTFVITKIQNACILFEASSPIN